MDEIWILNLTRKVKQQSNKFCNGQFHIGVLIIIKGMQGMGQSYLSDHTMPKIELYFLFFFFIIGTQTSYHISIFLHTFLICIFSLI